MLSLQLDVNVPNPIPHGHPRGLDLGFDTDGFNFRGNLGNRVLKFVSTSDGEEVKRPKFLKTLQSKLKLASDPASSVSGRTPRRRQAHLVADRARERASCCNVD